MRHPSSTDPLFYLIKWGKDSVKKVQKKEKTKNERKKDTHDIPHGPKSRGQ